jgi:formate dehydrogenase major subunit
VAGLATTLGSGSMTNSISEIAAMGPGDALCVIGSNTTECHPVIGLAMLEAKRRGAALVVIDPREIDLTRQADVWLRLTPGTDVTVLSALARVIVDEGLADLDFIARRTEGFAAFCQGLAAFAPEDVAAVCGLPAETLRRAARLLGKAANVAFYYTMGVTQHITGTDNVLAVSNLALATGNLGRPKTGVNPLRGQNNVQGSCDMGALPNVLPGYRPVADEAARAAFEAAWGVRLPATPGLTLPQMLEAAEHGTLRAVYVLGENPMRSDPDVAHVEHCLKALDFLVVQDIFLTETAALADVVLPGASFAEKDGTFSNTERRVQRVRRAVSPVGDSRPDWLILADLLARLGRPERYETPEDIFDELCRLTPSHAGMSYARLEGGGLQWPCPDASHPGTPILHVGRFARGLGRFMPLVARCRAEPPDAAYPLTLSTGRIATHYHTATMTRRCFGLAGAAPEELAEVHPDDAARYGIDDGGRMTVRSRRGQVTVRAQVTRRVPPGMVFMTFHFTQSPANALTTAAADPVAGTPSLKACAVAIGKAEAVDEEGRGLRRPGEALPLLDLSAGGLRPPAPTYGEGCGGVDVGG